MRSIEILTYLARFTCLSDIPCIVYVAVVDFLLLDNENVFHLLGLNSMFTSFSIVGYC